MTAETTITETTIRRSRGSSRRARRRLLVDIAVAVTFLAAWITHDQGAVLHSLVSIAFTAAVLVHARLRQPGWRQRRRLDHLTLLLVAAIAATGMVDWVTSGSVSTGHGAIAIAGSLIVAAHVWQHRRSLRRLIDRARSRARTAPPSLSTPDPAGVIATTTSPVRLTTKTAADHDPVPIVCSLGPDQARQRIEEWSRIVGGRPGTATAVTARHPIESGIRFEFDHTVDTSALVALAQAERDCCRFFRFAITVDDRGIGLDVTAPADASILIDALFGPT